MRMEKKRKSVFISFLKLHFFHFSIILFIGTSFINISPLQINNGWYKQTIPSLNDSIIRDIHFIDTTTGFLITNRYLLKTTNSGDNWFFNYDIGVNDGFQKIKFLNKDTGTAISGFKVLKTTNQGLNWIVYDFTYYDYNFFDFQMFGNDTIWASGSNVYYGKIFLSTNGGANWQYKFQGNSWELKHIYFFNKSVGYCSDEEMKIYKTTDGGNTWILYLNEPMFQIHFVDSLTGWRCNGINMKKTTDGGATWFEQQLPQTNMSNWYGMLRFSVLNKDTIWGVGGLINFYYPAGSRGIIYKTTNGGLNWGYQLPDTSINFIYQPYYFCNFKDSMHGWCYSKFIGGVHTKVGGSDSTIFTGIRKIETTNSPSKFILFQNYPNPFNSNSNIKYKIEKTVFIKIIVFDITGNEITTLVNKKQSSGIYEVKFDGINLSSGLYFYTLFINGNRIDTKKLVLIK